MLDRYMARFSGDGEPDPRASWLAWPEFQQAFTAADPDDPLTWVGKKTGEYRSNFTTPAGQPLREAFAFPNLTIDLEIVI